jgi:glycosyltransferase involved in cell wall biosynthesis
MEPTLSVALPNYNHARYLPESLAAICEQSLPPKELIVVDDASTDGSVGIIEDFARRYPFVRLLRNEKNMGAIHSFNRAIAAAAGDFVLCPAADDRVLPGLFEKTARLLGKHPGAGLCSAMCRLIGGDGEDLGPLHVPVISETECCVPPERFLAVQRRHGNWLMSQTAFYNRQALQEWGGGFDPELGPAADAFLLFVLAARHGACFIPERLGSWRKLDDSFALRTADDVQGALRRALLLDRKLRATELFSAEFREASLRSSLMAILYETLRRRPYRFEEMAALEGAFPRRTWREGVFFALLRLLMGTGRLAAKLYLYLAQPPQARRRIAAEKLDRVLDRRREVALLILYDGEGRMLLQHRSRDAALMPGYWAFFGGGIEAGEALMDGLRREAWEELRYRPVSPRLLRTQDFREGAMRGRLHIFTEAFSGDKSRLELHEGDGWGWFRLEETPALLMTERDRGIIAALAESLGRRGGPRGG